MSVNPLGWYIVAKSPSQRQRIVEDQRKPSTFPVSYYRPAEIVAQKYLLSGGTAADELAQAIQRLSAPTTSEYKRVTQINCIAAIQHLPQVVKQIEFGEQRTVTTSGGIIVIAGLDVSVRPEIVLATRRSDGVSEMGAVKLYFSKDKPLTKDVGFNIAVALQMYMEKSHSNSRIGRQRCQVVDVFAGTVWTPPESQKRRRDDIEAACREILARWDSTRVAA